MLTALLVGLLGPQPQTVTFSHPCAHSSVVLEALGKELGVKMGPGGSVLQDYFAVKFTDRPIEDVKRVIAETLNAVWIQRGEYLVLDRGRTQEQKELDVETATFRDGIERYLKANPVREYSLEKIRAEMIAAKSVRVEPGSERRSTPELDAVMPAGRFGARIVRAIGTEALLYVTEDRPLRYYLRADGTTNMTAQVRKIVEDFRKESDAVYELGVIEDAGVFLGGYGPPSPVPLGYTLSITRSGFEYAITIARDLFQPSNNSFHRAFSRISIMRGAEPASAEPTVELPAPSGKLSLSPEALSMMRVMSVRKGFPLPPEQPNDADMEVALRLAKDLAKNDPLTMYGGAPLQLAADQERRDYVALLPDYYLFIGASIADRELAPARWRSLIQSMRIGEDEQTKILKIVPYGIKQTRQRRLDREAASRFVSEFHRSGHMTLDALADFMKGMKDEQAMFGSFEFVNPLLPVSLQTYGKFEALKVYGCLSDYQRKQAREGGYAAAWDTLPKDIQVLLARQVLSDKAGFSESPPDAPATWQPDVWSLGGSLKLGPLAFESVVPPATTFRVRVLTTTLLKPGPSSNGASGRELLTPERFAARHRDRASDYSPDFSRATVASAERVHLDVHVPGIGYLHFSAQVDDTTEKTKYVPLNQLPEPWKSQLADAIKKAGGGTQ